VGFKTELSDEELELIVEALRIQRERWHDVVMRKMANDPGVSAIDLGRAVEIEQRHEALLARLPDRGLSV